MEERKKNRIYKIIMLEILTIFLTIMITAIGVYSYFMNNKELGNYILVESSDGEDIANELSKFKKIIDKYYIGEVDEEKLKEGAIKGYIEGLDDPYSEYISKEEMEEYMEQTNGNFVGIGIYMTKDLENDRVVILSTIKNSPAEKAGLQAGDLIISVDGTEYKADDMTEASNKIKGEENTTVELEILRNGQKLSFEIKREKVKVNEIETEVLESNIGYMNISSFDEETGADFKEKFEQLQQKNITSLIIDLRNNGGGIVDEALEIAECIADKGSILLYEINKENEEEIIKSEEDPIVNIPVILLVNENTASSSEILAGALKDLGKAKIVGTKTYGKGVIQTLLSLKDGSGIKITSAEYLTPNKNKINEIGIEPDYVVELPDGVDVLEVERENDTQLEKAIELLK